MNNETRSHDHLKRKKKEKKREKRKKEKKNIYIYKKKIELLIEVNVVMWNQGILYVVHFFQQIVDIFFLCDLCS